MAQISQADAKQYDRQIRLWGAQAQQRLSESRVLLIGLSSLGAEVAKNIVLAGVKSLCIFDPTLVTDKDSSNVFLFRPTDHGSRVSAQPSSSPNSSHNDVSERSLCDAKASGSEPFM
jgi:ubiquitin-like 1-activating enzyme E1 A